MVTTALLVPIKGPLRVQSRTDGIDVESLIDGDGTYVAFGVRDGETETGQVGFRVLEGVDVINLRARTILADLTGVHMVITGTAAFCDLPAEDLTAILRAYA